VDGATDFDVYHLTSKKKGVERKKQLKHMLGSPNSGKGQRKENKEIGFLEVDQTKARGRKSKRSDLNESSITLMMRRLRARGLLQKETRDMFHRRRKESKILREG